MSEILYENIFIKTRRQQAIIYAANDYLSTRKSYMDMVGMRKGLNKFLKEVNKNIAWKQLRLNLVEPITGKHLSVDTTHARVRMYSYDSAMRAFNGSIDDNTLLWSIGLNCLGTKLIKFEVFYDLTKNDQYLVRFDNGSDDEDYYCSGSQLADTIISHFPTWVKTFAHTSNKLVQELKKYFTFTEKKGILEVEQIPGKVFHGCKYETEDRLGKVLYEIKYDYEKREFNEQYLNRANANIRFKTMKDKVRAIDDVITSHKKNYVIANTEQGRIMFFHSNPVDHPLGVNTKAVKKFMKLYSKGKVGYFVCCHPDDTGIDEHHYLGAGNIGRTEVFQYLPDDPADDDPLVYTLHIEKKDPK